MAATYLMVSIVLVNVVVGYVVESMGSDVIVMIWFFFAKKDD